MSMKVKQFNVTWYAPESRSEMQAFATGRIEDGKLRVLAEVSFPDKEGGATLTINPNDVERAQLFDWLNGVIADRASGSVREA